MIDTTSEVSLVPERSCAGCTLCCKVIAVPPLGKSRLEWCAHCEIGVGCRIFGQPERPAECARFYCWYRQTTDLGEEWRPADCGFVVSYEGRAKRINISVDPDRPDAWRVEPFYSRIKAMALSMLRQQGHLIVWVGENGIAVLPHKEVTLGPPTGNQVIVAGRRLTPQGEEYEVMALDRDDPRLKALAAAGQKPQPG